MKNNFFALTGLVLWAGTTILGGNAAQTASSSTPQPRSADTCADPSLVVTFIQAYQVNAVGYAFATVAGFASSLASANSLYVGKAFDAWLTPQNFTTPLYELFNPTTQDWLITVSTDGNPPSIAGFTSNTILGYVYSSQVCGSVPLLGGFNQAKGSHFYTTDANDHSELIGISGWTDAGIAAYVLPVDSDSP